MTLRNGFALGDWAVHPLEGRLSRAGSDCRVQPKSMEVLLHLVEAAGAVVERETLLAEVWGERAVSDEPLTRCIGELRRALGDSRSSPDYILTIPKRGYRLLKTARPLEVPAGRQPTTSLPRRAVLVIGAGLLVVAGLLISGKLADESTQRAAPVDTTRSIAVLPFADMSAAGDQEYMSDGIAEEVLNLLARLPRLRVISRTSAFAFKGTATEIGEIARQLNVAYVLEGSVRTSAERIRITVQLIDARADSHIWSEAYDRERGDVFEVQDEIAAAVASKLQLTLLSDTPRSRQTDPEAYSLFLQARYLHEQPAGDSFRRAFDFYEAALAIDENYVPAWVWLAALYDDTVNSLDMPREEVGRLAREAIDAARAIDPNDPLALGMSGVLRAAWDKDYESAAAHMQQAVDTDPHNPILLRWAGILLTYLGRFDDAIAVNEYLFERDPVGKIAKINLASTYLLAGRFEDAARICEIQAAIESDIGPCRSRLVDAYLNTGDPARAFESLQHLQGSRSFTRFAAMVYYALGRESDYEAALAALQEAYADGDKGMAYWLGRTYTMSGNIDLALDWYERAASDDVFGIDQVMPHHDRLRDEPRWAALMQRAGLSRDARAGISLDVTVPAY